MSGEENSSNEEEQPPAGQPQAQPAGQAGAQPAGQGPPGQPQGTVRQAPSLTDELQKPESMYWIKFNVALFAVFGVGYSLAFFLFEALLPGGPSGQVGSGLLAVLAFFGGMFVAPVLAAVTGLRIGSQFREEQNLTLVNSFVGSAAGFLVMFFVLFVFVWSQAGGSGAGLGDLLAPVIGFAIGVGLTGLLTTYVVRWVDGR